MTESPSEEPAASNNADLTRGRPFEKGNTAGRGRPEGSRNKATLLLDKLDDEEAEAIQRQVRGRLHESRRASVCLVKLSGRLSGSAG
jgi:hypothetical protein